MNNMDWHNFALLVRDMRQAQRDYLSTRSMVNLDRVKRLQSRVDQFVERFESEEADRITDAYFFPLPV